MQLWMFQSYVRKTKIIFLLIIFLFVSIAEGQSQGLEDFTNKEKKPHSAHKASLYSFALPGLGQAYNKKYWKIPIIYAGFGFLVYMIKTNRKEYKLYESAYKFEPVDENDTPPNDYYELYSTAQLKQGRDYYRRNMELSYILTGFWYLLNVIDASVDAHLFDFKISSDLSMKIEPYFYHQPTNNQTITGLRLQVAIPGVFGFK